MTKEQIGSILKELRLQTGKTQKDVAEILGRKQQIVGHWETGYAQPDANTLFTLCEIYGTTVDAAFGFKKKDISISRDDLSLIEKYHDLDSHGKEMVDFILNKEIERIKSYGKMTNEPNNVRNYNKRLISYYFKNASAGTGQIVIDNLPEKDIEIPDIPKYRYVSYAIGVNGSSMEPLYSNGDILLVEATQEIQIGEIGIFSVNNECYVKKVGEKELISLNQDYPNIPLNETARCMGKVIDKL